MVNDSPYEDIYVEAVSSKITEFLNKKGFDVVPQSISRQDENRFPYDRLYDLGSKIFGLQFKRPYLDNGEICWALDRQQHQTLKKFKWIFYLLPYYTDKKDYHNALYLTRILKGNFQFVPRVYFKKNIGMDWGIFITEVLKCNFGLKPRRVQNYLNFKHDHLDRFLKYIEQYRWNWSEDKKFVWEPGHSYLQLMMIDLDGKKVTPYLYYYPDEILYKLD